MGSRTGAINAPIGDISNSGDFSNSRDFSSLDISDDTGLCTFSCKDCGNQFAGVRVGINLKCPECHSENTKMEL